MIGPDDEDEEPGTDRQDEDDDPIPCPGCGQTGECESYCPELAERCRQADVDGRSEAAGKIVDKLIDTLSDRGAVSTGNGIFLPDGLRDELIRQVVEAMSEGC